MKNNIRAYLALFLILIYTMSVLVSILPKISFLQVFQTWILGTSSTFSYPNFYWVFSSITLVITHQSFIDTNKKNNLSMLGVLCFLLASATTLTANISNIDDHLLRFPSFLIGIIMIGSTLINNHSLTYYDRKCQLVSMTDLDNKHYVDFFHTVLVTLGLGIFYSIVSG